MDPLRRLFGHSHHATGTTLEELPPPRHSGPSSGSSAQKHVPTSLRSVFNTSPPPPTPPPSEPDLIDSAAFLASSAMRRSRLDESAGEGLRRSVLVRNAMLSSLERERDSSRSVTPTLALVDWMEAKPAIKDDLAQIQRSDSSMGAQEPVIEPERVVSSRKHFEREVQWFEALLSELGSEDDMGELDPLLDEEDQAGDEAEDDFVAIDLPNDVASCSAQECHFSAEAVVTPSSRQRPSVCASADSGFAERGSPVSSTVSGSKSGYPYICPYPSMMLAGSASSEELPALVEDDSDADDDDDDDDTPLAEPEENPLAEALISRPMSPVDNIAGIEQGGAAYVLSPPSTRPCSPTLSSSSKDSEQSNVVGICEPPPSLGLLTEFAMRSPAQAGPYSESLDFALSQFRNPIASEFGAAATALAPHCSTSRLPWQAICSVAPSRDVADNVRSGCRGIVREYSHTRNTAASSCSPAGCQLGAASCAASPSACASACFAAQLEATREGGDIISHWPAG